MIARGAIPTLTDSLPLRLTNRRKQIKCPVTWQASQPHIEIVTEVVPGESCAGVSQELLIKESKDYGYIRESIRAFKLLITYTQEYILMIGTIPRSFAVNHNEINLMVMTADTFCCMVPPVAGTVFVTDLLFNECFRAIRIRAVSDTRIYYATHDFCNTRYLR
jgi:hypothetical protein